MTVKEHIEALQLMIEKGILLEDDFVMTMLNEGSGWHLAPCHRHTLPVINEVADKVLFNNGAIAFYRSTK